MTAANLFVRPDGAYLLSDTGSYGDDGTVRYLGSKVVASSRLRIAFVSSGMGFDTMAADSRAWLDRQPDQATALRILREDWREFELDMLKLCEQPGGIAPAPMQAYVAVWSHERDQPEAYIIGGTRNTFGPGYRPYTLTGVAQIFQPPVDRSLYDRAIADPAGAAFDLLQAQRQVLKDGTSRVGGAIELTTVTRQGVSTRRLARWPDKIGGKIEPSSFPKRGPQFAFPVSLGGTRFLR